MDPKNKWTLSSPGRCGFLTAPIPKCPLNCGLYYNMKIGATPILECVDVTIVAMMLILMAAGIMGCGDTDEDIDVLLECRLRNTNVPELQSTAHPCVTRTKEDTA